MAEQANPEVETSTDDLESALENQEVDMTEEDSEEVQDSEDSDTEDSEDTTEEPEDEGEDKPEEEESADKKPEAEEQPESKEPDEKQRNREMAEKRLAAKAEREAALKAEQQEYIAKADEDDPRDLAVRQLQVDAYNNKVDANTNKLTNGYERAVKDFDILRSEDPVIQAEVDSAVDAFQAQHVQIDKYGNPTEVTGDLYAYLQAKADSIAKLTGWREKQQAADKDKEKSKVLATPSRAPKQPKKNPMLEGFEEEAARW